MKVVHVVTAFPRSPADPITPWLVRLLHELERREVETEVLAPSYRGLSAGEVEGIKVRRFRYAPARWETLTHEQTVPDRLRDSPIYTALLPAYLAGGVLAARRLGRGRPDVVHVHWPLPHALFGVALRKASQGRTAMVCSFYGVELSWVEHGLKWLLPWLRWSARTADAVTAISSYTAERVERLVQRPVSVIPFAAAVDLVETRAGPATATSEMASVPFQRDEIQLLFVGRLVERKGVEVLIRALPRILRARPVRLTIVGEGSWEEKIRKTVAACEMESRVRFTGHISRHELRKLYAACDMFVLPAVVDSKGDTEGLGVVLLEALRFARPVVASAVGGIPDIVEPAVSGWLVPPDDPQALAAAVLEAAANPEEARRIGLSGQCRMERYFSWERIVDELLKTYSAAVQRRREPRSL